MEDIKKNSLLIVDDERSNISALTHILSSHYAIYAAKNGEDAIETANEYLPDVILLDIVMPDMDGYEVLSALKSTERTRQIPVIFVTGLNDACDEEKGLYLGAVDYISKPYSAAIVKLRVENQIKMLNYINTIERLSMIDQLTDLPNRRSFDERLRLEWGRSKREKTPICVLLLDLDYFKKYNDTHGHLQGDKALQEVAKILRREFKREVDFVARWGGEEFAAVLSNTGGAEALSIAERVRECIADTQIPLDDGGLTSLTVSIGLNVQVPQPDSSSELFVRNADDALYTAKKEGRDKVCLHKA